MSLKSTLYVSVWIGVVKLQSPIASTGGHVCWPTTTFVCTDTRFHRAVKLESVKQGPFSKDVHISVYLNLAFMAINICSNWLLLVRVLFHNSDFLFWFEKRKSEITRWFPFFIFNFKMKNQKNRFNFLIFIYHLELKIRKLFLWQSTFVKKLVIVNILLAKNILFEVNSCNLK